MSSGLSRISQILSRCESETFVESLAVDGLLPLVLRSPILLADRIERTDLVVLSYYRVSLFFFGLLGVTSITKNLTSATTSTLRFSNRLFSRSIFSGRGSSNLLYARVVWARCNPPC